MAYVSLYRKYRPQSFAEVVGQPHVTQTLANALTEDRLHHAYLFTGPRGTGKTSTARILAKALNCDRGPTAEPCQVCEHCVAITDGSSLDVVELDMASHGGVDDARELRERALFAPARARRKVYILDEVHMASNAAFNALLKLIEEPPGHVLFAMATTDPQKVLPTIMSRVQRLDLRRVPAQDLADHLRGIAELEGATLDDAAIDAVVRAGDGSVRDSLSVLDQVLSFTGGTAGAADVARLLGQTPPERCFDAAALVAAQDVAGLLALVQGLLDDGHDLRRFTLDLVAHLRDLLVLQAAPDRPDLIDATAEHRARLSSQAGLLPREALVRAVDQLGEVLAEMRRGPIRLALELALAKIAMPAAGGDVAALAERVARLEAGIGQAGPEPARAGAPRPEPGDAPAAPAVSAEPATAPQSPVPAAPPAAPSAAVADDGWDADEAAETTVPEPDAPTADADAGTPDASDGDLTLLDVLQRWPEVLDALKRESVRGHAFFAAGTPGAVQQGRLVLRYPADRSFHATQASSAEFLELATTVVAHVYGRPLRIVTQVDEPGAPPPAGSTVLALDDGVDVLDLDDATAPRPTAADAARADELLRTHLGAQLLDDDG